MKPNTSQNKEVVQTLSSQPTWQLNLFLLDKLFLKPCPIYLLQLSFCLFVFLCVTHYTTYMHLHVYLLYLQTAWSLHLPISCICLENLNHKNRL